MGRFTKNQTAEVEEEVKEEMKQDEVKVGNVPILQVSDVKTVKIRPNFSGNKYVGDTWYHFVKGEVIVVPKNVKDILVEQKGIEAM